MTRKYLLAVSCGKELIRVDSWGVIADGFVSDLDAEALEQLGKRLIAEARVLRLKRVA